MAFLEGLERSLRQPREGSQDESHDPSDGALPTAFLPSLQVLELRDVAFRGHRSARKRRGKPSPAHRLEAALRTRKQHGLLLEKLYIIRPIYLEDYGYDPYERMEGLAAKIVCKGYGDAGMNGHYCSTCDTNTETEDEASEDEGRTTSDLPGPAVAQNTKGTVMG